MPGSIEIGKSFQNINEASEYTFHVHAPSGNAYYRPRTFVNNVERLNFSKYKAWFPKLTQGDGYDNRNWVNLLLQDNEIIYQGHVQKWNGVPDPGDIEKASRVVTFMYMKTEGNRNRQYCFLGVYEFCSVVDDGHDGQLLQRVSNTFPILHERKS